MSGARPDTWMPFHIGPYLGDTMHLSRDQHGGYLLLILAYWRRGSPLPDDDGYLSATVKATIAEWRKLRPVLAAFFRVGDGVWRHKRIEAELALAIKNTETKRNAGRAGGEAARGKSGRKQSNGYVNGETNGTEIAELIADELQNNTPLPLPRTFATSATESYPDRPSPSLAARAGKFKALGSGSSEGRFGSQQARDEFAVSQCVEHLPGRDEGERWQVAIAAEDPASPNHGEACRQMLAAAKKAGVGWVSPARRKTKGAA